MGKENEKHFSLRIDADLLRKITYIAKGEERSVNGMLLFMIRDRISKYEKENGTITEEDLKSLLLWTHNGFIYYIIQQKRSIVKS